MKQKLLNLKSLLLLLLMTVSMGARAQEIPTFGSISDLRKADITGPTVVNVTIDGSVISIESTVNGYLVELESASMIHFSVSAPGTPDPEWKLWGKVTGTLNNVTWNPANNTLTSETDIWSSLTFKAPPTYDSLQELSNKSSNAHVTVNNVNDVIESCAEIAPNTGNYMVQLRNSYIFMTIIDKDLNWLTGGTVTGSLNNVSWEKGQIGGMIRGNSEDYWKTLEYTAPEVKTYESIEALQAGQIDNKTTVNLTLNNKIAEAKLNGDTYEVTLDNGFIIESVTYEDLGWVAGGTVSGTLYNVVCNQFKESVLDQNGKAIKELTYTAPVPTYASLDELIKSSGFLGDKIVNVTIDVVIHYAWKVEDGNDVYYKVNPKHRTYGNIEFVAPAPETDLNWLKGGTLKGTLMNVKWKNGMISSDDVHFWDAFTYTAPEVKMYDSVADMLADETIKKDGATVSVKINNTISKIETFKSTLEVYLDDDKIYIQGDTNLGLDWEVGGTLTGTLTNVAYTALTPPKLITPYGDIFEGLTYTAPAPTYEFFEDLLVAPSYDYVNVNNVYDVIAECKEVHADTYEVKLKNSGISLIITTKDLGWVAGGTVTGSLSNVGWDKDYRFIYLNSTEGLQYIAPFNSLSELAEAAKTGKIGPGTMVSVSLNNEITKIYTENDGMQFVVVKDGDYTFDLVAMGSCSEEWKVGGTLATKEGENWTAIISWYKENNYNLYNSAANAWGNLDYTAPKVPTYASLDDLIKSGFFEEKIVNVTIDVVIHYAWKEKDGNDVLYYKVNPKHKYGNIELEAPAPETDLNWLKGGTLKGTLMNVKWYGGKIWSDDVHFWDALTYTAPEVKMYDSVADMLADEAIQKDGATVSVKINNTISKIETFKSTLEVYLDDDKIYIQGDTNLGLDWEVGGTLTGTLINVAYTALTPPKLITPYGDIFEGLTYTAPVAVTVNDCGNASFSCGKALDFTNSAVKAYMVTAESAESVTITEIKKVPAYTGIFVVGEAGTYNIPVLDGDADDASANLLEATITPKAVIPAENIWALSKNDGKLHHVTSGTITTGKAYFVSTINNTAAARGFVFVDDNDATSINSAATVKATGVAYNLAGQRVNANAKGIVIVNGKKFINK